MSDILGPKVAVDAVIFAVREQKVSVLLLKIGKGPYENYWAVPGGLVKLGESLDSAVKRVALQKANIKNIYLEQLYTFGDPQRDVRGQSVSVAYFALINNPQKFFLKTAPFYAGIKWHSLKNLPQMAFDHKKIIEFAYQRLKSKMEYSNIVYSLLPDNFTLTELQKIYEIIWQKKLDKRNFRKKMLALGLIENVGQIEKGRAYRPAGLYRFKKKKLIYTG